MNATPPVSQSPIASDPAQQNTAAPVNSVNSGGDRPDFAAALRSAGTKPARRPAGTKPADDGSVGGSLPVPGNLSPPPAAPIAAAGTVAQTAAARAVAGPQAGGRPAPVMPGVPAKVGQNSRGASAGSPVAAGAQNGVSPGGESAPALGPLVDGQPASPLSGAPLELGGSGGAAIGSSTAISGGLQSTVSPGAQLAQALGLPGADLAEAAAPDAPAAGTIGGAAGKAAAGTAPAGTAAVERVAAGSTAAQIDAAGAAAASTGAAAAASRTVSAAQAGAAAGTARKPMTAAAATAAFNAATSGPSSTGGNAAPSTNDGAWINTDASAQAATASAMAAAATGAAPVDAAFAGAADSPSSPADALAPAAMGGAARGSARPNGAALPAVSVPAAAAAAKAAANASANAPTADALADLGRADPRAPGGAGDSPLSDTSGNAAAGAAQLSVSTPAVADAAPAPTLKVAAGMDTPEFGQGLADRVSWMVDNNLNGAKLQVNPPQLGPIEVRIAVQGNHAQVWLTSHSAVTRDALESSSPKLREMLGAQGFGQVSVDISQRSYQERSPQPQPYDWTPSASRSPGAAAVQSAASLLPRAASGAVDAYA